MTIRVDRTKCSGIGLCEVTAPAVFEVADDGQSRVVLESAVGDDLTVAKDAASSCPTGAISVDD